MALPSERVTLLERVDAYVCVGLPGKKGKRGKSCGTVILTKRDANFSWVCPIHGYNTDLFCLEADMPIPSVLVELSHA